jgi:hypothetical protein
LIGIHLTLVFNYPSGREDFSTMTEAERKYASKTQQWIFTQGANCRGIKGSSKRKDFESFHILAPT